MLFLKKIFMAALLVSAVGQLLCFTQAKAVDVYEENIIRILRIILFYQCINIL